MEESKVKTVEEIQRATTILMAIADGDIVSKHEALSSGIELHNILIDINEEKSTENKQSFELHTELSNSILHAANFWKTDSEWSNHLSQINQICDDLKLKKDHITKLEAENDKLKAALLNIRNRTKQPVIYNIITKALENEI